MATRKQILTVFMIAFTVVVMVFFMTSDYRFNFNFAANSQFSHPLKLQHGYATPAGPAGKFFAHEDVVVNVYETEEGEVVVVPVVTDTVVVEAPQGETPDVPMATQAMRDMLAGAEEKEPVEKEADMPKAAEEGMDNREFPPVDLTGPTTKPTTPTTPTTETTTTEEETTPTTTPTPTTPVTHGKKHKAKEHEKKDHVIARRHVVAINMIPTTGPSTTSSEKQIESTSTSTTTTQLTSTSTEKTTLANVTTTDTASSTTTHDTENPDKQPKAVTSQVQAVSTVAPITKKVPAVNTTFSSDNYSEDELREISSYENELMSHVDHDYNVVVNDMDLPEELQSDDESNEILNY